MRLPGLLVAAPAAAQVTTPATKWKLGRPRKKPAELAEARAESDRIHCEEAQLRETRKEMLRRGRAVEERAAAALAEEQHSAALLHNPAGGAPLTIIKCSSRAIKATLDPEGNPLIHPVIRTHGDVGNGGRLALRVLGSDVLRAQEDAEMLAKLSGKKASATKKTSAVKNAVSNGATKRKASDTIPVGETAAKRALGELRLIWCHNDFFFLAEETLKFSSTLTSPLKVCSPIWVEFRDLRQVLGKITREVKDLIEEERRGGRAQGGKRAMGRAGRAGSEQRAGREGRGRKREAASGVPE
ncbi:hypothetical protein B0H14DRAFT_2628250 [Mycena olivaceomarginata]|nr:hypothetical protein B0H14DRAFT_2628250 [Mycena olivaceomarginata]